jgi:lipoprotein-anchoring transpeptidase ErfK/SrfK
MWRQRRCRAGAQVAVIGALLMVCPVAAGAASAARPPPVATEAASAAGLPLVSIAAPTRGGGATIANIVETTSARSEPDAGRVVWRAQPQTDWSGEPQSLLVLGSAVRGGQLWLRLLLPIRPDGTSAWIPRNRVTLSRTRYWLVVAKHRRLVQVYVDGALRDSFPAVIGKPATPTPDGLAAIYERDRQPDPAGFLGPWALPLTALSNVLRSFGGGPGRIAIHGRGGPSLLNPLGSAASHGCIRIDNGPVTWLATHVPQGAPVQITG